MSIIGKLHGKVAIITGAAGGTGSASARLLAGEGAAVVVSDIRLDEARKAAGEIAAAGGEVLAVQTDVRDEEQVLALAGAARETFGGQAVLFLASPDSSFFTGAALVADGGVTAR